MCHNTLQDTLLLPSLLSSPGQVRDYPQLGGGHEPDPDIAEHNDSIYPARATAFNLGLFDKTSHLQHLDFLLCLLICLHHRTHTCLHTLTNHLSRADPIFSTTSTTTKGTDLTLNTISQIMELVWGGGGPCFFL